MSVARLRLPLPPSTASAELAAIVAPLIGSMPDELARAWQNKGLAYSDPLSTEDAQQLAHALTAFRLQPEIVAETVDPFDSSPTEPFTVDQLRAFIPPEGPARPLPPRGMLPSRPPPRVATPSQPPPRMGAPSQPPPRAFSPLSSPPPPLRPVGLPAPKRSSRPPAAIESRPSMPSVRPAAVQPPLCHPPRARDAVARATPPAAQAAVMDQRQRAERRTTLLMLMGISTLLVGILLFIQ